MSRETFTIESIETKPSTRGPFKRAKLSGIGYVSVFNDGDKDFLEENLGQTASAEIRIDNAEKGWKSASAFQKASPNGSQAAGEAMSKREWDDKEDRTRGGISLAVHIEHMIEWKTRFPHAPDAVLWETYDEVVIAARKKAIKDLDWVRNYLTSDPPFEPEGT